MNTEKNSRVFILNKENKEKYIAEAKNINNNENKLTTALISNSKVIRKKIQLIHMKKDYSIYSRLSLQVDLS